MRTLRVLLVGFALVSTSHISHATEFKFHGLLEVTAAQRGTAFDLNARFRDDNPFDAYGLRLFADALVSERLQVFTQVVLQDATSPYVYGAYLMYTPFAGRDLHVLAGKVPWAVGTYAPRTYSNRNPLIGAPLLYQHHSTLLWYEVVPSADLLLGAAGTGPYGVNLFGYSESRGMAVVDDSYWDAGVTIAGSERPFEYAIGIVAGAPGWGSTSQDDNSGKSILGRLGLAPLPGVRLGISGCYGPYLNEGVNRLLPPGRANDYQQKLVMADLELLAGQIELRAEGARNGGETPYTGELGVTAGYAELQYRFPVGAFVAGRWDAIRYSEISSSSGARLPWDWNLTRIESGVGYRFTREVLGKIVYQRNEIDTGVAGAASTVDDLFAAQVSVRF